MHRCSNFEGYWTNEDAMHSLLEVLFMLRSGADVLLLSTVPFRSRLSVAMQIKINGEPQKPFDESQEAFRREFGFPHHQQRYRSSHRNSRSGAANARSC